MEETTFLRHSQLLSDFHLFYPDMLFLGASEDQIPHSH